MRIKSPKGHAGKQPSVLLASMPWTTIYEPSLGLGLLRAVLDREKIPCRVLHINLFLLQFLKSETYHALGNVYALNDFLFSGTLDPVVTNTQQRLLRPKVDELLNQCIIDVSLYGGPEGVVEKLLHLRSEVIPAWLESWADEIARSDANLVGFTCMFDQTIASLALAQLVRKRAPEKMLVLGGYAVRSPASRMILKSNPWIDAVCEGEGEVTIVKLARASAGEIPLDEVPGIVFRSATGDLVTTAPPPPADMNLNPLSNFDDFYADTKRLSDDYLVDLTPRNLPIENSRGCWWGAKSHCIFCGIRDDDLVYRARNAGNVLNSMTELRRRYGVRAFRFSDYILPYQYFETLLPELIRMGRPYLLSAEIKANITTERFAMLAQAGFEEVQPGIESFSSDVLRKMHKGVSAVQNVHTMLLGKQFGVRVLYNLLYGFPDDDPGEYEHMVNMLPRLVHLEPPVTCVPVQITRWAPMQMRPEAFGIEYAQAESAYDLIFSGAYIERTGFDMEDFCFYFERPFENSIRLQRLYDKIIDIVTVWRRLYASKKDWLYQEDAVNADGVTIHDRRSEEEKVYHLDAGSAEVLRACERPVTLTTLRDRQFLTVSPHEAEGIVDSLDSLGLIFREGQHLISLVLPGPPAAVLLQNESSVQ